MEGANDVPLKSVRNKHKKMENVIDMAERVFVLCRIVNVLFFTEGGVVVMVDIVFVMSTDAIKEAPPINLKCVQHISTFLLQRS